MNLSELWLITLGMALVTFATRISFIALWGKLRLSPQVQAALRFVPAAVFAAIVVQAIAVVNGRPALSADNPRLLAGLIALAIALKWRNELLTIGLGLIALTILTALG